ncbi:calcitonin gene-related peptide 2 isoform X1 [Papio anubis]|uniref:calcitonin gene-related peptide 2 isoform X1 n=1 Tax=Papio anubis TaxID=9555 RepID=UPI000B7B9904|nr:calcitonin gene-related peptide 2 isoform X1 [Papio anubis]XP_031509211.1 calcitonin gene-related peptide 2 isoform X1 [Papio anubis]
MPCPLGVAVATSPGEEAATRKPGCLSWGGAGSGSQPAMSLLSFHRSALESSPDPATLSEEEARLLLAALVQDYVQMKASELEQEQETGGYSSAAQKRACNTATCVTHRLAGLLSRSGGMVKSNFVPTNVGSKAFGRRRRDLHA